MHSFRDEIGSTLRTALRLHPCAADVITEGAIGQEDVSLRGVLINAVARSTM